MTAIPFPLSSSPGKFPHESAGRLKNCYSEPLAAGARAANAWRRAPGLKTFSNATAQTGFRGSLLVGSLLYAAFSNNVSTIDPSGNVASVGAVTGTGGVFWARNNVVPVPDVVVVDPANGAFLVTESAVTAYNASGILPQPNSVCFQDGYLFFTTGDGRCFATDLNATTMNADCFVTAEGFTGGLLRGVVFDALYLCGPNGIEVWQDTAQPAPGFPYSRVVVIPKGIIGRYAITGWEPGFGKGLIFVGSDKIVYALNGYVPTTLSTPDVARAISSYIDAGGDPDQIVLSPYVIGGHSCVVMTSPAWTWVLDLDNARWTERFSYEQLNWRASRTVQAFGQWLAGDAVSNTIVAISEGALDELGSPMIWEVESGPVSPFPNRMAVAMAAFDMAQGLGIATGTPNVVNPMVEISWTDDGGVTWSTPRLVPLGAQATRVDPIRLFKTGQTGTAGRRWRLRVSDAVPVSLVGGDQAIEVRQA